MPVMYLYNEKGSVTVGVHPSKVQEHLAKGWVLEPKQPKKRGSLKTAKKDFSLTHNIKEEG